MKALNVRMRQNYTLMLLRRNQRRKGLVLMFIEACYMPDSGPDTLWSVPSVPTIALCYRHCYYPHFLDKETEAESGYITYQYFSAKV